MSQLAQLPRRTVCAVCVDDITFNNVITTVTSNAVFCRHFHEFNLMLNVAVGGTPTDILFDILFSFNNINYYKYMNGPFGDLRWVATPAAVAESIIGQCVANYIKLRATATDTTSENTFTVTSRLVLAR